jgi:hypothetical protein
VWLLMNFCSKNIFPERKSLRKYGVFFLFHDMLLSFGFWVKPVRNLCTSSNKSTNQTTNGAANFTTHS